MNIKDDIEVDIALIYGGRYFFVHLGAHAFYVNAMSSSMSSAMFV